MPVPTQDDSLISDVGDTKFGAYPSSLHPQREDNDALASQNNLNVTATRTEVFNIKETEDSSSKESKDGQATEDCIVLKVTDQAQDSHEFLISEEDKLEPRNNTVAAFWLSPVSVLGKHMPPIYKTRGPEPSIPQLVPRAKPPRKAPERNMPGQIQMMTIKIH